MNHHNSDPQDNPNENFSDLWEQYHYSEDTTYVGTVPL